MLTRLISSIIGIAIFVLIYFVSGTILFNVIVSIISVIAIYEVFVTTKYVKNPELIMISMLLAGAIPFFQYYSNRVIAIVLFVYVVLVSIMLIVNSERYKIEQIGLTFLITIMIPLFFTNIVLTRNMPNGNILYWLIFIGAWINDTGAFFTGKFLGKIKLAPLISPKKTVEGAVGGVLITTVVFVAFGIIATNISALQFNLIRIAIMGFICALLAILGDLFASIIKREFGAKDYGNIMPGHGGVMDRFDSVLFVAPFVYLFLHYFPIV